MKLKVIGRGSSGNCYLLQNKSKTLILECGIKYKGILKKIDFDLSDVIGCLVSHSHKDHSKSIKEFIKYAIDIYTSSDVINNSIVNSNYLHEISPLEQFNIKDFTILPFDAEHDVPNLGFLIQHKDMGKLLFITDSYYCKYKFPGLNHIMIECNYSENILDENVENGLIHPVLANRLLKSHFSLENVKEFLKANDLSKVRDITLIHLSSTNSDYNLFKKEIERLTGLPVYIAEKNLEIELLPN